MIRRTLAALLSLLLLTAFAYANAPLPIDEAAIVADMERLIDETPPTDESTAKKVAKLLERGIAAHDQRKLDKAIKQYRKALEHDPLNALAYYELAFSLFEKGEVVQALEAATRALVIDPKQAIFYVLKANILDTLGHSDAALSTYETLLAAHPEDLMGLLNYGIALEKQQRYAEAETAYEKAIEHHPGHPSAYFHYARLCRTRGYNYDEERLLDQFVERGQKDPRLPSVEARLKELKALEIRMDPTDPHAAVSLAANMARAVWRTTTHRERFPEARGYHPTIEEEREVASTILEIWRGKKSEDPDAKHSEYDLLVDAADAGHLDAFLYTTRSPALGEAAASWLSEHPEEVAALTKWLSDRGIALPQNTPRASLLDEARSGVEKLLTRVTKSEVKYAVQQGGAEHAARFLETESGRFAGLALPTGPKLRCSGTVKRGEKQNRAEGLSVVFPILRCYRPGSEEHAAAARLAMVHGVRLEEIAFSPRGAVLFADGGATVHASASAELSYWLAKAAWRLEEGFAKANGGPEDPAQPSIEEEIFAVLMAAGSYANARENAAAESEAEEIQPEDPAMERAIAACETGDLAGFVLYEILYKRYGLDLDALDEGLANRVDAYVGRYVMVRTDQAQM